MESFQESVREYRRQLDRGEIQKAYRGLMEYMLDLRTQLANKYPGYLVPGSLYYGYMDMTYFSLVPQALKEHKLKVAVVFLHEQCRFEAWLAGYNKQVQAKYWKLIGDSGWSKYPLVPSIEGEDAIIESVLVNEPDFSDLQALTRRIEKGTLKLIQDVESFLGKHS